MPQGRGSGLKPPAMLGALAAPHVCYASPLSLSPYPLFPLSSAYAPMLLICCIPFPHRCFFPHIPHRSPVNSCNRCHCSPAHMGAHILSSYPNIVATAPLPTWGRISYHYIRNRAPAPLPLLAHLSIHYIRNRAPAPLRHRFSAPR